jgi:hypothetical protein
MGGWALHLSDPLDNAWGVNALVLEVLHDVKELIVHLWHARLATRRNADAHTSRDGCGGSLRRALERRLDVLQVGQRILHL